MAKQKLTRLADDATHARLVEELREHEEALPAKRNALTAATQALEQAQERAKLVQTRVLAGRASDADLAAAQGELVRTQRAHAQALLTYEDTERMVRLLPPAIAEAKAAALALIAENLRAEYATAVTDLKAKLQAAAEANAKVAALYDQAEQQFPLPGEPHPAFKQSGWHVIPLGDDCATVRAARLTDLRFAPLTPAYHTFGQSAPSAFDLWAQQADAHVAELPRMAEEERAFFARYRAHYAQEQARQRELERAELARTRRDAAQLAAFTAEQEAADRPA